MLLLQLSRRRRGQRAGTRSPACPAPAAAPSSCCTTCTTTHPARPALPRSTLPLFRSMADNIHAVVSGEGGLPSAVQWVMLGISLLMCVVGAAFVSYSIK